MSRLRDFLVDSVIRALCVIFFWRFRIVPDALTAEPMLRQFALIRGGSFLGRRFGALYFQHFDRPEPSDFAHCHRWGAMRSWVLSGSFVEERFQDHTRPQASKWIAHFAGTRYDMDRTTIHRVEWWSRDCWTLFHMSPEIHDDWGWFQLLKVGAHSLQQLGPLRPWREHIAKRVPSLDTGEVTL